eukprot:GHVT01013312.1.p2 GENE.GHVT01013312.1~~GHVT01013312.1.p2  ORF type:complete len:103 (+),score=7.37 GHVT01013312.1:130-438(+)
MNMLFNVRHKVQDTALHPLAPEKLATDISMLDFILLWLCVLVNLRKYKQRRRMNTFKTYGTNKYDAHYEALHAIHSPPKSLAGIFQCSILFCCGFVFWLFIV